jgi:predicted small lipoprotein YifL
MFLAADLALITNSPLESIAGILSSVGPPGPLNLPPSAKAGTLIIENISSSILLDLFIKPSSNKSKLS